MPGYKVNGVELIIEDHPQVYPPSDDTLLLAGSIGPVRGRVLEIGTGSGLIAVLCARLGARVVATDINPHAVRLARHNAARNGVGVDSVETDLFDGIRGAFDIVVFNPPYLPTTRGDITGDRWLDVSVDGGPDGLGPARRFLAGLESHLSPEGRAFTLYSSLSGGRLEAPAGFASSAVAEKKLVFELLTVLEVHRKGAHHRGRDAR